MGLFMLGSGALLAVSVLLAAWRRRGVVPYDDPLMTVEVLRDRQRFLYEFGVPIGPTWPPDTTRTHRRVG